MKNEERIDSSGEISGSYIDPETFHMVYVHRTAIVDGPPDIGNETYIRHFCHIMSGCKIGSGCSIGQNGFIASGVTIGNNVKIQNNVSIYEGVEIEDDVFIGPSVVFTNVSNPRASVDKKDQYEKTVVKKGATIGANATIVCGITIGEYAFIGAGSVITKDVPPFAMVVGNPARAIGTVDKDGNRSVLLGNQ